MGPKIKLLINYVAIISLSLYVSLKYTNFSQEDHDSIIIINKDINKNTELKDFNIYGKFINSMLRNNVVAIFTFANILFISTFCVDSINNIDLSWGLMIFYLLNFNYLSMSETLHKINFSFFGFFTSDLRNLILLIPVFLFSTKHIYFVLRGFRGFEKSEIDFRYREYTLTEEDLKQQGLSRTFKKIKNWIAIYFNFHFMNCFIIGFIVYPIIECVFFNALNLINNDGLFNYRNIDGEINKKYIIFWLGFLLSLIGIIIETISDEQLTQFRIKKINAKDKEKSKVIFEGLWKICRHPNYFGEIIFYWTLIILNYALIGRLQLHNFLGSIVMTSVFLTYSIPVMEKHMLNKHSGEYREYMKKVPRKFFPLIY